MFSFEKKRGSEGAKKETNIFFETTTIFGLFAGLFNQVIWSKQ
jgi:hypothetical protein